MHKLCSESLRLDDDRKNASAVVKKHLMTSTLRSPFTTQPDCSVGWDSSRDCWYFGYDLYILTDADSDLPLFPLYFGITLEQ